MFHLTKTVMNGPCLVQSMRGEVVNIAVIDRYKAIWRTMSSFLYVYIVKTTFRRLRAGRDNLREILVTVQTEKQFSLLFTLIWKQETL